LRPKLLSAYLLCVLFGVLFSSVVNMISDCDFRSLTSTTLLRSIKDQIARELLVNEPNLFIRDGARRTG
jgi:hypothetical protein